MFYGAQAGGVMGVTIAAIINMNIEKIGHLMIRGEDNADMSEKEFSEMFEWIREKVKIN